MSNHGENATATESTFWTSRLWKLTRAAIQKRSMVWPRVGEITGFGPTVLNAEDLLNLCNISLDSQVKIECERTLKEMVELHNGLNLQYPENWAMEFETLRFLFFLVCQTRPITLVETGIADGHSTFVLLSALKAANTDSATLVSTDISHQSGVIVDRPTTLTDNPFPTWKKIILPVNDAHAFQRILNKFRLIDIFIHDSNHAYRWQTIEYQTAWHHLQPGGWLCSDDIDASYAFLNFCRAVGQTPMILFDHRKFFGVLRKPTE